MKKTLLVCLLSCLAGSVAMAQQPTPPASRTLTPAEQRQKEKIEREVQRNREIRAEMARKQREYEARQAEKERQRQAKRAEKENKEKPAEPAPVSPAPQPEQPAVSEPKATRKERREKPPKETPAPPVVTPAAPAPPVEAPAKPAKTERPQRQRERPVPAIDSTETAVAAPAKPASVRPTREFLPTGHLFEPILLDPLEAQAYGSVLPVFVTNGERYKGSFVPFAFGFAKPFYRRTTEPGRSEEWVLDVASFTQFEVYQDLVRNKQRRQIVNTDYKVSILYNVRRGANTYRFRVYHLSSHLGDDYLFRNQITAPSPNAVNYEQLDVTYSRMEGDWRLYGGLGVVLRRPEERKPLSAQLGAFYKKPSNNFARLVGGVDVKFWQQTQFRPGVHAGVGVEVGKTQRNLTFLAELYSGFRPYSQFEDQKTFWLGIGMYLNPF